MLNFTKPKFLSLQPAKQHWHLARLLRDYHQDKTRVKSWKQYQELLSYLNMDLNIELLEDRYHHHLNQAGKRLKEHNLLQSEQVDRDTPLSCAIPVDVVMDNLRSAHNVGSIARTVEAFGLGGLYGMGLTPAPSPKTAMGAEKWISFKNTTLSEIQKPIVAIELAEGAVPYNEALFPETFTLAVGNEERGCSKEVLQAASLIVYIPMHGRKNSLNVANAFAIVAAEIARKHPSRSKA